MLIETFFVKKVADLVTELAQMLGSLRKNRRAEIDNIEKTFGPVDYLAPYYVVPDAQNVNPADLEEDDTGLVARNNVFDLLNNFLSGDHRFSHAFILSDSGMGKSSLLIMLKLFYLNKFIRPDFDIHLLKLGNDTIDKINQIKNPGRVVLLLDALDEDPEAWRHFYGRTQIILQNTKNFRKVLITCRTQFFPQEHEEDGRIPGQVLLSGFRCSKLFLSPFTIDQVDQYLSKRFTDKTVREKARVIVEKMRSLKFRPMLLSYIDFLLEHDRPYANAHEIYEVLVEEWLDRELRKGIIKDKEPLRAACFEIAGAMYVTKERDISSEKLRAMYSSVEGAREIEYMSVEGRSLLQRTSEGSYKFSHYSILEYFVATAIVKSPRHVENTDQVISFIADMLGHRKLKTAHNLQLQGIFVTGADLSSTTFRESNLTGGKLIDCNLKGAVFKEADLSRADFSGSNLERVNMESSKIFETIFTGANLSGARFSNLDFSKCRMDRCIINETIASAVNFSEANLSESILKGTTISSCSFSRANLQSAFLEDSCFEFGNFMNVQLAKCQASRVNLYSANLEGAQLDGCVMVSANLEKAAMRGSSVKVANLAMSKCANAIFTDSDLSGIDFTSADLESAVMKSVRAVKADFRRAKMDGVIMDSAVVERSLFSDARMSDALLRDIEASGASFANCYLARVKFEGSNLGGGSFASSQILDCCFDRIKAEGIDLLGSKIADSRFEKSEMMKGDLSEAKIENASFRASNLSHTKWIKATIKGANFETVNLRGALFREGDIEESNFSGAHLEGVIFSDARLKNCKWGLAIYDRETLWPAGFDCTKIGALGPRAFLTGKHFSGLTLDGVNLMNAELGRANFAKCSLKRAILEGANLQHAELASADLLAANLSKSNLVGADLSGAILSDANLEGSVIRGGSLQGAKYNERTIFPEKFDPSKFGMIFLRTVSLK